MALNVKSRWAAFAIHLAISLVILIGLLAIIFFFWFPKDLIFAGGIGGLKILMGVDLVLGPLLTLLVYQQHKPSLRMDLTIIGLIQAACLLAGLWLIFNERPIVQVLADDGVHLLAASDLDYFEMTTPDIPGSTPKYVMLDLPEDRAKIGSIKFTTEFVEEKPFTFRDDLYLDMSSQSSDRYQSRIDFIQELMTEEDVAALAALNAKECDWIPLHSKHASGFACVNREDGIMRLSERRFFEANPETDESATQ
jgi:hypothetical protein